MGWDIFCNDEEDKWPRRNLPGNLTRFNAGTPGDKDIWFLHQHNFDESTSEELKEKLKEILSAIEKHSLYPKIEVMKKEAPDIRVRLLSDDLVKTGDQPWEEMGQQVSSFDILTSRLTQFHYFVLDLIKTAEAHPGSQWESGI